MFAYRLRMRRFDHVSGKFFFVSTMSQQNLTSNMFPVVPVRFAKRSEMTLFGVFRLPMRQRPASDTLMQYAGYGSWVQGARPRGHAHTAPGCLCLAKSRYAHSEATSSCADGTRSTGIPPAEFYIRPRHECTCCAVPVHNAIRT